MENQIENERSTNLKFCKYCGERIPADAVICTKCGRQVEELKTQQPSIVINNDNSSKNLNTNANINNVGGRFGKPKNKWIALLLCFFIGYLGAHKFYEGKVGMGILYLLTAGLLGIGIFIDFIVLLFKPTTYFV